MESSSKQAREVRAARNQALFRSLNEKLKPLNESFASVTDTFTIACECADQSCVEMIDVHPREYVAIRDDPRHFAVLAGHVYPDVERVVSEGDTYVVVEKFGTAGDVAESLNQSAQLR